MTFDIVQGVQEELSLFLPSFPPPPLPLRREKLDASVQLETDRLNFPPGQAYMLRYSGAA